MLLLRKTTEPSARDACTPPGCSEKGSVTRALALPNRNRCIDGYEPLSDDDFSFINAEFRRELRTKVAQMDMAACGVAGRDGGRNVTRQDESFRKTLGIQAFEM